MNNNFVNNLENEMNDLEYQINNEQRINKKRKTIRCLKISLATIRRLAPYSLILVLSTTGWKTITGSYPFIRDAKNKVPKKIMIEIDNYGNIKEQGQYRGFENKQNLVKYYTNWEKTSDGFYTREVSTYILKDASDENIENILTKKENIQDKYNPLSRIEEKQNNIEISLIKLDDINYKEYMKYLCYKKEELNLKKYENQNLRNAYKFNMGNNQINN